MWDLDERLEQNYKVRGLTYTPICRLALDDVEPERVSFGPEPSLALPKVSVDTDGGTWTEQSWVS